MYRYSCLNHLGKNVETFPELFWNMKTCFLAHVFHCHMLKTVWMSDKWGRGIESGVKHPLSKWNKNGEPHPKPWDAQERNEWLVLSIHQSHHKLVIRVITADSTNICFVGECSMPSSNTHPLGTGQMRIYLWIAFAELGQKLLSPRELMVTPLFKRGIDALYICELQCALYRETI